MYFYTKHESSFLIQIVARRLPIEVFAETVELLRRLRAVSLYPSVPSNGHCPDAGSGSNGSEVTHVTYAISLSQPLRDVAGGHPTQRAARAGRMAAASEPSLDAFECQLKLN